MTLPLPDETFEATAQTHRYDLALRSADDVAGVLADFVNPIARVLGVADLPVAESSQVTGGDPVDLALVAAGLDLRTTVTRHRSGDLSVFLVRGRHVRGIDERGRHERLLTQRGGVSVCEIVVCTSLRRTLAGGARELDQAHVRITHGLDSMLGGVLTEAIAALQERPSVVVSPDADLDGVRLGGGRTSGGGTDRAKVDWTMLPATLESVRDCFDQYIQLCFEQFELGLVPAFETTTTRTANTPSQSPAPGGPFSVLTRSTATTSDGRVRLVLSTVEAYRSDDEVDHVSVNLDMRTATDRLRVVATGRSGAACTQLRLHRPTSGAAVEALWATFAPLLDAPA